LWQWHRVAQEVGRSAGYLQRITEVAREVAQGKGLSEQAKVAMMKDLKSFGERQVAQSGVKGRVKPCISP
jgi:hypothetical protein